MRQLRFDPIRRPMPRATMPLTVTTLALPDAALSLLREVGEVRGPDGWEAALPEAEGLLSLLTVRVDAGLLERAPRLKIVANAVVGYDNVDVAACRARGVVVTNTPDVLTDASADLTMALLLATVRRLPQAERSLRAGEFHGWRFWDYLGGDVTGAALGIFGMGRIGQAVARRARPFGMRVQYHSRTRLPPEVEAELGATWVERETLLTTSDILSLHAPSTPQTRHVLDEAALRRMRRGSYLINTARGPLVDEAALARVLRDGHLAGAGLDVYEREPEVEPGLLELPNAVLLPHIGSATPRTREAMATLAARNVHAVLSGREPVTPV
jgi:glyoxylate reductase